MKDYTGKAPIYQKWGEKDFAYDTAHLHWQAGLLYRALLQKAWHLSTRPDLPADDSQLQNILGVPSDVWDAHKGAVRAMFMLDAEKGVLWQKRLRCDWKVLVNYRETQRELALKRNKSADTQELTQGSDTQELKQRREEHSIAKKQLPASLQLAPSYLSPTVTAKASPISLGSNAAQAKMPAAQGGDSPNDVSLSPVGVVSVNPLPQTEPPPPSVSDPSSGESQVREKKSQRLGQGKLSPDIAHIVSVCHELHCQIPTSESVQALLDESPVTEIEEAFREYVDGDETEYNGHDPDFAEKLFFADGGGAGIIIARRRRVAAGEQI